MKSNKTKVGVIGASGYTGLELVKLLVNHPGFEIEYLATSEGNTEIESLHPSLKHVVEKSVETVDIEKIINICELVFLSLPHKASMGIAKQLISKNIKVVDLSADYRLEQDVYEAHYTTHTDPDNLPGAVYGLIEYYRDELRNTSLAAGPGCYPTATLLGLLPLIPYIDTDAPIFVDAKSGVSGAGKKLSDNTHFVNINENIFAYNPLSHRHAPEISEKIAKIHGVKTHINFVPHLIPATRGELISIYATLKKDIDPLEVLRKQYADERFIRIREKPVDIKSTAGTHFCDIYAKRDGKALWINSAIDNLLRGAASQALAAANLMCGYDEGAGLPVIAYVP
jgi:N-acetyl-gamma-glutamyl-phosphate reductase